MEIKSKKKTISMVSNKAFGLFTTKKQVLKKKKQIILMESKKDCGQNGTKMVKKEEKEILKMVKETVHGPLGMKTEIRNF